MPIALSASQMAQTKKTSLLEFFTLEFLFDIRCYPLLNAFKIPTITVEYYFQVTFQNLIFYYFTLYLAGVEKGFFKKKL